MLQGSGTSLVATVNDSQQRQYNSSQSLSRRPMPRIPQPVLSFPFLLHVSIAIPSAVLHVRPHALHSIVLQVLSNCWDGRPWRSESRKLYV